MSWWAWWLIGAASVPVGVVVFFLLAWAVSPGRGWSYRCGFGHYPYAMPQYGPSCDWQISAGKWFPPEWTKGLRHRWHWWRTHPVSGRKYQRDYMEHRKAQQARQQESTESSPR